MICDSCVCHVTRVLSRVVAPYATDVSTAGTELEMLNEKMNALSQVMPVLVVLVLVLMMMLMLMTTLMIMRSMNSFTGKNVVGKRAHKNQGAAPCNSNIFAIHGIIATR